MAIVVLLVCMLAGQVCCSLYDPHAFPQKGPFFEGWYFRFIDFHNNRSFATLFGIVLPKDLSKAHNPAYFGVLRQNGAEGKLLNYDSTPDMKHVHLTVGEGKNVSEDPSLKTPAHFTWKVPNVGYVDVKPSTSNVNVTIGDVRLEADIGAPHLWDESGRGPMGWLGSLPLPLSWFVYSLGSPVNHYKWTELKTGKSMTGKGFVHMEKNWGKSFPKGWIWAEGMAPDGNVAFAATYGPVGFGPIGVPGHLIGYRNFKKGISIDFRPDNSYLSKTYDGCKGSALFTLYAVWWKVTINLTTSPQTYSECLLGPMSNGFRPVAQESYVAQAHITVYKRNYLKWDMLDSQLLHLAALEFGGAFSCHKKCEAKL